MTYSYSAAITSDAVMLSAIQTCLTTAGWQTTTNANPYVNTGSYYVYKSPAASNIAGVDWYVTVWNDTTNHRTAIMPHETFVDAATPTYGRFCNSAFSTIGGDGYNTSQTTTVGAFTGGPGCMIAEWTSGTATLLIRADYNSIAFASIGGTGVRRGGWCGLPDYYAYNPERPDLILMTNPYNGNYTYSLWPPAAAAALPAVAAQAISLSRDTMGLNSLVYGANTQWQISGIGGCWGMTNYFSGSTTSDQFALRDAYDTSKIITLPYYFVQAPNSGSVASHPRIRIHGTMRDCLTAAGMQPEVGDLLTVSGVSYRCFGTNSTNYLRALFVKAT